LVNSDTSGPFGWPADHKLLSLLRQFFECCSPSPFDVVAVRAPLSAAWIADEHSECFIVRYPTRQALSYFS
jgi:hypothetical protein